MSEFQFGPWQGVDEVMDALDNLAPELHEELVKHMDNAAEAIAGAVDGAVPGDAPLSGMDDHDGRTGWRVGRGGSFVRREERTSGKGTDWPVYRIGMSGAASVMADMAASGNTRSGEEMVAYLNRQGQASRWVWPTAKANTAKVVSGMTDACEKLGDDMTARLADKG